MKNAAYSKKRKVTYRFFTFLIRMILFLFLIWVFMFFYWAYTLPSAPSSTPETQAIVVLTGAKGRLQASARLLSQGHGQRLLISGVNPIVSSQELFKQLPDISASLRNKIDIGRVARNTIGNAYETKGWMRQNNFQSAILVTSNWHIQRSLLEFKHLMPQYHFVAAPVLSKDQKDNGPFWYFNKEWLLRLSKEYTKLSWRWLYFKISELF